MSMQRSLLCLIALTITALASLSDAVARSYDTLLREADAARSGDADHYLSLLAELDQRMDQATPVQRQHLRYLHAYQTARSGDFTSTIQEMRELSANGINADIRFRAGVFLANNYSAIREFSDGLRVLEASLAMLPEITDPLLRHQGQLTAAILYNQVGQHELALDHVQQVLDTSPNPRNHCLARSMQLEAQFHLDRPDERPAFNEVIGTCVDAGEMLLAGFPRVYLARSLAENDDTAGAISYLHNVLPEIEATRYPRLISEIHALLAGSHLTQGNLASAERHAREAIRQGHGVASYTEHVAAAHHTLYEIAMQRGDSAAALDHHRRYAETDRAYLDNVKARELAFQMVRHETLQKNQTIELLNQRNEVLQLEQRVARQTTTNQRLLLAILVTLLASIAYWAYKVKRLQMSFRKLAETDTLTGLSNRHHFHRHAAHLLAQAQRQGKPAAVVMVDLDHFKRVNDRFGHATGDWLLKRVGEACASICRNGDLVGRLGGEEFALLLVACPTRAASEMAERCRQRITEIDTDDTGHDFTVTASFGVAATEVHGYDLQTLLRQADAAMYAAKAGGRDLVNVAAGTGESEADPDSDPDRHRPGGGKLRVVSG